MTLSNLQVVVLSKIAGQLDKKADVAPGAHSFDFTVRVKGQATRGEDSEQKATCRALTMETLALFIQRAGMQREKALEILVDVMTDNIVRDASQQDALLKITGVKAAMVRLDAEMDKLPKTKKKGAFKFKGVEVTDCSAASAVIVGDTGPTDHTAVVVPHIDEISVDE